jgi:hypothetical protein
VVNATVQPASSGTDHLEEVDKWWFKAKVKTI